MAEELWGNSLKNDWLKVALFRKHKKIGFNFDWKIMSLITQI